MAVQEHIITVINDLSECKKLSSFLSSFISNEKLPDNIFTDLKLVIEEVFSNIVTHAYSDSQTHDITVILNHHGKKISLQITDNGIAFNPLTDAPAYNEKTDHAEGGMGIHIIKSLTDKQAYQRLNKRNILTLTKFSDNSG